MAEQDEKWVLYRRTSVANGKVAFYVGRKDRFAQILKETGNNNYIRELMMEADSIDVAEKAKALAEGK